MSLNPGTAHRAFVAALGTAAFAGAIALAAAPPALADPQPNCTAADVARIAAGVSAQVSDYFFAHPDVNDFFTSLKGQPRDAVRSQVIDYMAANPQADSDLSGIRQPLVDMKNRCSSDESGIA